MKNKSSCSCTGAAGLQSTTNLKTNMISGNSSSYSSDSPMSIPHERRMGLRPTNPASSRSNTITEQLHEDSKECNYVSQLSSTTTTAAAAARHTSSCSSQEQEQGAQEAQEALSRTRVTTTKLLSSAASSEPGDPKRRKISQQKRTVLVSVVAGNGTRSSSEDVPADLWAWRKYGQKPIKGSPYPRGYYRCSSSKGCLARKQVERSHNDPSMLIISYSAEHNHPWPSHRNSLAGSTRVTSSASKLAKGESAADQVACTRSSAATLEKQKSSLSMITQLKAESEEHAALIPCHDHSVEEEEEEEEVPGQEEKENFANDPSADEESKANPVVTIPSYKLQQQSAAITSSGFSTTSVCAHYGAAGFKQVEPVLNVQVSSGQVQIAVQSYAESSCNDHVNMLNSLYSSSSMEPSMDEDFFIELEELIPDSSMATFGWSHRSCFLQDQSNDEEEVFMDTKSLIRSVLDGYNVCIFVYGQTGTGKTFTMSGPNNMTQFNWGVNYRALHDLFHMTQSRLDVFHYEIGVQMLEIYNEQVRDLLNTDGVHRKLEIRNKSQLNGLNVPDASMMPVRSTEDVMELMKVGQRNRAVGATALNERSSRSHSVLTVHVQGTDLGSGAVLQGSLHLVDLAGSERVDKSEATGDRLKEAQHINKSLSALGDVIAALAQKSGHVPYRNSKLTQLLQDSLGGQAKTLMFVHISPDVESFGETVSTLKFAERVSSVELGAARSNKESGEVQNLRDEVAQLRDAAAKKDAEIERLQALKDRAPAGESNLGIEKLKLKAFGGSPLARRISMEPAAVQRNRKHIMDAEVRHSMHKIPGLPKQPPSLVLSTSHDSEDAVENIVSSSACSPVESPTECKVSFDGPEEVAINMSDKLKLLKTRHGSLGQSLAAVDSDNVVHIIKPKSKQEESVLANHGEIIMHDKQYLLSILDTTLQIAPNASQPESVVEEWHDRFQKSGDESLSASQVYEKLPRSSMYLTGQDRAELGIARAIAPIQSTSRLKPPLDGVFSSQQVSNWFFDPSIQEPMPAATDEQKNCDVVTKRSSYMLNNVVLDEHFENDGMFDLRDGYQDDSGSLFSESGLSVETDLPSLGPVDQNKKLQSSSVQPRHERKALLQTQVRHPPIRSSSKISPLRSDRRSLGGQQQPRPRRYTNVAIAVSTDKPIAKRNVSLGGNSAPEGEFNVSQDGGSENNSPYDAGLKPSLSRNMSGGKSLKRWI